VSRSRNIKPGFFKNEALAELPFEYRILFQGLWCEADREGRLEDRPRRLKAELFPYDSVDVDAGLSALVNAGFIARYTVAGQRYIEVLKFAKHQNPHKKETPSTIPAWDRSVQDREIPEQAPEIPERAGLIPDSLNLIPDSKKLAPKGDLLDGISPEVASDFKALRSKLRAPITATAMKGIRREAALAGVDLEAALVICCERGWRGFKAEWLRDARAGPPPNQPFGKTAQAISQLQAMKNELAENRTADRVPEAALLGPGSNPR
jgi:hypothetical protein